MTVTTEKTSIPAYNLKFDSTLTTVELHFTGGLRARETASGWQIAPFMRGARTVIVRGIPTGKIRSVGSALGLTLFGEDTISAEDPNLPMRVWKPLIGPPLLAMLPSDTWAMIASTARVAGDDDYARLARNLSVTLRAAGLQIRNASDEYSKQLVAALRRGQRVGGRFSNVPILELHLSFHSVLTEMASARDYLAQIAARRCNAPNNIDALSRLKRWVVKPANTAAKNDPLIMRLMEASNSAGSDSWLADLTEYRNLFLHREPIAAMAQWLMVEERESSIGPVRTLSMAINTRPGVNATCDALARFVDLYERLCRLADFAATVAPYAATPLHFTFKNDK